MSYLTSQMPDTAQGRPKRTPFHDLHLALGARMVPFAGFEMPVFSHMREFFAREPRAIDFVSHVTTNYVTALTSDDVVNASNGAADCAHILPQLSRFDCTLQDARDDVALSALQGPLAERVLAWLGA